MKLGKIRLIPAQSLRPHERTNKENLEKIINDIRKKKCLRDPIIAEKDHLIILDGHHRAKALGLLGCKKIPVYLVDYFDKKLRVLQRRPKIKITKKIIIEKALSGKVFPHKTSKHLIPDRPRDLNVPLEKLKKS